MRKIFSRICFVSILFLTFFSLNVFAQGVSNEEEVTNFDLEMNINEDGSADVTEKFSINMTERLQEYSINRSFPVEYSGKKVKLEIVEVLNGEEKIDCNLVRKNRNLVLRLVKKDEKLDVGLQDFTIKYNIKNLVNFNKNDNEILWHLFGDEWIVPIKNYFIRVNFPDGTDIKLNETKVYSLVNEMKLENFNITKNVYDSNTIQLSGKKLVYPGEDLLLDVFIQKGTINENSSNMYIEFFKENVISFCLLIFGLILFVWELIEIKKKNVVVVSEEEKSDKVLYSKSVLKCLIALTGIVFSLIISITIGMALDYDGATNYVLNVFVKFLSMLFMDGILALILYYIIRYKIYKCSVASKILGGLVCIFLVVTGVVFSSQYLCDMFYNWFAYLILILMFLWNIYFAIIMRKRDIN